MDQAFLNSLFAQYPDTLTSGTVTRTQIVETMKVMGTTKYPSWILKNRAGRGVYLIPGVAKSTPSFTEEIETQAKMQKQDFSLVPKVDPNYVPFGNHKDIEVIVKSKQFYPTYISGPTGNGKSTMIEQVCAKYKRPMIRVNLNGMTDEDQLIGSKTLVDGSVQIVEGPLLVAMRQGIPIVLDEIDAGTANTLLCLQPILEGKPYYFKLNNEMIYPSPGFTVFATANTKGKGSEDGRYIGTNILNEAFLERFAVTFNQEYPNPTVEKKIIINLMGSLNCVDEDYASTLVKWADAIRRTFADGGVDETITTRRLVHIVKTFSMFKDKKKSVELCINRFDEITRMSFADLFDKVCTDSSDVVVDTSTSDSSEVEEDLPF